MVTDKRLSMVKPMPSKGSRIFPGRSFFKPYGYVIVITGTVSGPAHPCAHKIRLIN